jgi:hypothetical protein
MTERSTVLQGQVHLHCDARKRPPQASHACCRVQAAEVAATSERRRRSDACRGRIAFVLKGVNTPLLKAFTKMLAQYNTPPFACACPSPSVHVSTRRVPSATAILPTQTGGARARICICEQPVHKLLECLNSCLKSCFVPFHFGWYLPWNTRVGTYGVQQGGSPWKKRLFLTCAQALGPKSSCLSVT